MTEEPDAQDGHDPSCSVLVVEDDRDAREMLRTFLTLEGYTVLTAANGLEALQALRSARPCIILLDIMMPVMDGWAFRRQQVADRELARIPVVCISAVFDADEVRRELGLRCLRKPYQFDRIVAEVKAACG